MPLLGRAWINDEQCLPILDRLAVGGKYLAHAARSAGLYLVEHIQRLDGGDHLALPDDVADLNKRFPIALHVRAKHADERRANLVGLARVVLFRRQLTEQGAVFIPAVVAKGDRDGCGLGEPELDAVAVLL